MRYYRPPAIHLHRKRAFDEVARPVFLIDFGGASRAEGFIFDYTGHNIYKSPQHASIRQDPRYDLREI